MWPAEDHIAFGAASRIQDDEDEARENELPCIQAVHSLVAQERPCAQDKDSVQYLEQENDGLRTVMNLNHVLKLSNMYSNGGRYHARPLGN